MKLDPNLYNLVFELATAMTNASEREATEEYWQHYQTLERECEAARRNDNVHPFLWETLADYTADNREALFIYKKGLALAETYELPEYSASISGVAPFPWTVWRLGFKQPVDNYFHSLAVIADRGMSDDGVGCTSLR